MSTYQISTTPARIALSLCMLLAGGFIIALVTFGGHASAQVDPYSSGSPSISPSLITHTSTPSPSDSVLGDIEKRDDDSDPKEILPEVKGKRVLPITGGDMMLFVATGASMIGTGALVLRRTRRRS